MRFHARIGRPSFRTAARLQIVLSLLVHRLGRRGTLWCLRLFGAVAAVMIVTIALRVMATLSPWTDAAFALLAAVIFAWWFERDDER